MDVCISSSSEERIFLPSSSFSLVGARFVRFLFLNLNSWGDFCTRIHPTTSERLAVKRSLRDMEQISAANKACASFSNKSICLVAVFDDQRRIKVHVETKEPLLLARMEGKTVVCSIVLDDLQLHASPDESKMDIDAVSITGTYDDDAVIVDSSVEEGKSESPSYNNDNNDVWGEVDYDNDVDEDYVYDENDESNLEYDENAFNNNNVCLSPCVDSDIIEQDVEGLPDINAETIDPKEDWIKKWRCLPNVAT